MILVRYVASSLLCLTLAPSPAQAAPQHWVAAWSAAPDQEGPPLSDPVAFPVAAFERLAISLYVPDSSKASTLHGVGMQSAYIADGEVTAQMKLAKSEINTSRY